VAPYSTHAQGGQQNVNVISVTALTSKMYSRRLRESESGGIPHLFGAPASPYRHCLSGSSWQQQQQQTRTTQSSVILILSILEGQNKPLHTLLSKAGRWGCPEDTVGHTST